MPAAHVGRAEALKGGELLRRCPSGRTADHRYQRRYKYFFYGIFS